ncbi:MAG: HD domain-containing protein [Fibrobacterota bacterium]
MTETIQNIYARYYSLFPAARDIVYIHSVQVKNFCRPIAEKTGADVALVESGALLHDIGVCRCNAEKIGCYGDLPYIQHGLAGEAILTKENLCKEAHIARSHVGVSISKEDITQQNLPLPAESMEPVTLEEKIIAYGDLFFSKRKEAFTQAKSVEAVLREVSRYGEKALHIFHEWHSMFS